MFGRHLRVLQQVCLHLCWNGKKSQIFTHTRVKFKCNTPSKNVSYSQYGYSYLEAGKNVMTLFKQKGWTVIVNDDLISNTLALFNLVVGACVGLFGLMMKDANPEWFVTFSDDTSAQMAAFG